MADKTTEQLQQELLEAKAQLSDLKVAPEAPKKPYSKAEIKEHEKSGHLIGNANQKLSEGHNEEDLQKWDMWQCELGLKDIGKIPEIGEVWSVPDYITPMKVVTKGKSGNDKSFHWENNQINFRERGANNQIFFNFPTGTVEPGKKYECHYFIEEKGHGVNRKKNVRLLVKDIPMVTGAPEDKTLWGKG